MKKSNRKSRIKCVTKSLKKKQFNRSTSGITLITLVITIIVLLILAGVSIVTLTGDNGILMQVTKEKEATEKAQELEQVQLAVISSATSNNGNISARELEKELHLEENSLSTKGPWSYTGNKNRYFIRRNGEVYITTNTTICKEKFWDFMNENIPEIILFTNTGASDLSNDLGTEEGEIYAWMEDTTMYISSKELNIYIKAPEDCSYFFSSYGSNSWSKNIKEIDCSWLDTTDVIYAGFGNLAYSGMFAYLSALTRLELGDFATNKVTNMSGMFYYDSSIVSLDLSSFDTSNVTNMGYMFGECRNIKNLNLSSFDTSKVTTMRWMFARKDIIVDLDLSSFNTANVTDMNNMFGNGFGINKIIVGKKWNTDKVTDSTNMFVNCGRLKNYNVSYVDKTYAHAGEDGYLTLKQ